MSFTNYISSFSIQTLIVLYFISNTLRVLSYVPQIIQVAKQKDDVKAISLITWSMWALSNLTTALYSLFVLPVADKLLAGINFANGMGCMIVILIVVSKRKAYNVKNNDLTRNNAILDFNYNK